MTDTAAKILIVDDDLRLAEMLQSYLGEMGFSTEHESAGLAGLERAQSRRFDAMVLDLMLPELDGMEICRRLRAHTDPDIARLPIVMLTARGDETDRIVGLELGADDYLPKPFNPRELVARLRSVLRRSGGQGPRPGAELLRFGRLEIDKGAREVRLAGEARPLTSHQFELLVVLAERAGRVQSRSQLMQAVRGHELEAFDRSIDVHISRIRAAIEDDAAHPRRIVTVRGSGYLFTESQD